MCGTGLAFGGIAGPSAYSSEGCKVIMGTKAMKAKLIEKKKE